MQQPTRAIWAPGVAVAATMLLLTGLASPGAPAVAEPAGPLPVACSSLRLDLANPRPGDVLFPGAYVMHGQATDALAASPPGVDRVQVFLDQTRDSGGRFVGQVLATDGGLVQYLTPTGFAVLVDLPDLSTENNTHVLYVYARSARSGEEVMLSVSVQFKLALSVGAFTPTPTPPPVMLSLPPCGSPTPTPTFPPLPVALAGATSVPASLTLNVFNPQPGDTLAHGMYLIQGVAFDPGASAGSGVDRVQVFLDPRDAGGQLLGDALLGGTSTGGPYGFVLAAPLPNRRGSHLISVYAHSSLSGSEAVVSIPVTLD
jgi:hypothetical protein